MAPPHRYSEWRARNLVSIKADALPPVDVGSAPKWGGMCPRPCHGGEETGTRGAGSGSKARVFISCCEISVDPSQHPLLLQIRKEAWSHGVAHRGVGGPGSEPRSPVSAPTPVPWAVWHLCLYF